MSEALQASELWPAHPLASRVALVTGCGRRSGIGGGIARVMGAAGATVVVVDIERTGKLGVMDTEADRDEHGLDGLVREVESRGGTAIALVGDVTSEDDVHRLVRETTGRFGALDILVNNASAAHGHEEQEIDRVPAYEWDRLLSVSGRGSWLLSRAAVPGMRDRGWGRIINISSVAGKVGLRNSAVYSATKAAVIGMTRSLAVELGPHGITVNAICPGAIRTERLRSSVLRAGAQDVDQAITDYAQAAPVRRVGTPEDIGAVATFLAGDGASFVTARAINVDGGGQPST